eukprot:5535381-Pyramimonas_sp.AAC.1
MRDTVRHAPTSSEFSASCSHVFNDECTRMKIIRWALICCSGRTAGPAAVFGGLAAGPANAPGARGRRVGKVCTFPRA